MLQLDQAITNTPTRTRWRWCYHCYLAWGLSMPERWEKVKTTACIAILDISPRANYYCSYGSPYSLQRWSASSSSPISIKAWTKSLCEACGQLFSHVLNMDLMHLSWSRGLLNLTLCRTQSSMSNWSLGLYQLVTCILTSSFRVGWGAASVRNTHHKTLLSLQ